MALCQTNLAEIMQFILFLSSTPQQYQKVARNPVGPHKQQLSSLINHLPMIDPAVCTDANFQQGVSSLLGHFSEVLGGAGQ